MEPLRIRVIVDTFGPDDAPIADYVFDMNNFAERRTFAEQMTNAYLGGQMVTTYAEDWAPGVKLKAFMAERWLQNAANETNEGNENG